MQRIALTAEPGTPRGAVVPEQRRLIFNEILLTVNRADIEGMENEC